MTGTLLLWGTEPGLQTNCFFIANERFFHPSRGRKNNKKSLIAEAHIFYRFICFTGNVKKVSGNGSSAKVKCQHSESIGLKP